MKRVRSLYLKNFITMTIVLLLSLLLLSASFLGISYQFIISEQTEGMREKIDNTGRMVEAYGREWGFEGLELRAALLWLSESSGFHILVCDEEGTIISCSDDELQCPHIGMSVPSTAIERIASKNEYYGAGTFGGVFSGNRYVAGKAIMAQTPGESFSGYIFLSGNATEMAVIWRQFAAIFFTVAIAVTVIFFIVNFFTTKRQTRPIKEMARAAYRFGRGDFSVRVVDADREDEIGELAGAFNMMADSLERSENTRRDLIANVSHELKTPMTTIIGYADGILDGTIPKEKEKEYLTVISSEAKRLSRLVRGMLDISQVQSMGGGEVVKKSFDLSEVIRLALLSLEKKITDKGLDVDARLPEEPVMVLGQEDSINQVVYNLLDNAAKFSEPDGVITVALWKEDGKAYISVENRGETISKEELSLIFERFHKTDKSRSADKEGVGLGLYIVKKILDGHNENIYVTSKNGETCFTFTLTLAKGS